MKVSIKTFQELYQISLMQLSEIDKSILLVSCLTGKTEKQVNEMNVNKFNKLCRDISTTFESLKLDEGKPSNYIKANGKRYFLNFDLAKPPMNAGRYVEVATFSGDVIGNLHKIMATMSNPMVLTWKGYKIQKFDAVNHERIADDMLEADFSIAYHSALFFYAVFSKSIENSHNYFLSLTENKSEMQKVLGNLSGVMDGFITAKWYRNLKILA
jgi:hypothetical protein